MIVVTVKSVIDGIPQPINEESSFLMNCETVAEAIQQAQAEIDQIYLSHQYEERTNEFIVLLPKHYGQQNYIHFGFRKLLEGGSVRNVLC